MARTNISIDTRDGRARATLFRPDIGQGPWPPVLVYHDGRGYRPSQFELAQRIASAGYLVLLPDLFYRAGDYTAPTALELSQDAAVRQTFAKYRATASPAPRRLHQGTHLRRRRHRGRLVSRQPEATPDRSPKRASSTWSRPIPEPSTAGFRATP